METKTMCFKAPKVIHDKVDKIVSLNSLIINKQSFVLSAVLREIDRQDKIDKKSEI